MTVNIKVTGAPFGGGSVHLFTQDGTAACGPPNMEYACIDQIYNFGPGDTTTPVKINVFATAQDFFPGGNGTFTVNLDNPFHGTIGTATGKVTIIDTDAPSVTISVADSQVVETNPLAPVPGGTANAEFIVSLSAPSDRPIFVHAQTADGTATATNDPATNDYVPVAVNLNFQPGETMKSVFVPVVNTPGRNEPEENFSLNLSTAVNATISKNSANCTIHQPVTAGPAVNIATRMRVLTGSNVLIAGFIVTGTQPKKVIIRGIDLLSPRSCRARSPIRPWSYIKAPILSPPTMIGKSTARTSNPRRTKFARRLFRQLTTWNRRSSRPWIPALTPRSWRERTAARASGWSKSTTSHSAPIPSWRTSAPGDSWMPETTS